jgi:hypothetical protein
VALSKGVHAARIIAEFARFTGCIRDWLLAVKTFHGKSTVI